MPTPQMTTAEALRSAFASNIACSAQELQEAVGQVVVATAAELPTSAAVAPEDRSVHDVATRTLVLLADRIPAGQEAQALASEIARHHGRQVAQAVLGDRASELLVAGLKRGKLLDLDAPALEVLVDIARTVGERRLVSGGDSRDNWRDMCEWADEFQAKFESNPEAGETYMEDVEAFAITKAEEAGWLICEAVESATQRAIINTTGVRSGQEVIGTSAVVSVKERKAEIQSEIAALIRERNGLSIREVARKQEAATVYMRFISPELILVRFEPGRLPTTAALHAGLTRMMHHYGLKRSACHLIEIADEGYEDKVFAGEINPGTGERWGASWSLWDWSPEGPVPYIGVDSKLAPPAADQHASAPSI